MSESTMKTVAVTGIEEFTTLDAPIPTVEANTVLVRVSYVGICGSDIPRYFSGGVHSFPQVLGHEFSGIVEEVGDGVTHVSAGQQVVVAPLVPCHECEYCTAGEFSMCPNYSFIGSRQQGAFAEYVLAPAVNVVPAEGLDADVAALVEPLTVALHALNLAEIKTSDEVTILGGGVIGLMALIGLRARGVEKVTVIDVNPWVLEKAGRFGAKATINSLETDPLDYFGRNTRPSVVVETACAPVTRTQALAIAAKKAKVLFIGTPTREWTLDIETFEHILRKELGLFGSWMSYSAPYPGSEWTEAPEILRGLGENAKEIISHRVELLNAVEGFEAIRNPEENRLKVMFRIPAKGEI